MPKLTPEELQDELSSLEEQGAGPNDLKRFASEQGYNIEPVGIEQPKESKSLLQRAAQVIDMPRRGFQGIGVGLQSLVEGKGPGISLERAAEATKPGFIPQSGEKIGAFTGNVIGTAPLATALAATGGGGIVGGALSGGGSSAIQEMSQTGKVNPVTTGINTVIGGTLGAFSPEALGGKRIMKPPISPERLEAVQSATKLKVPLTAADVTGSRPMALGESLMEKTLFGSGPIQRFRQAQLGRVEEITNRLNQSLGTEESAGSIGTKMKDIFAREVKDRVSQAKDLYKYRDALVPDNAPIELPDTEKIAHEVLLRQSKLPSSERNGGLTDLASDILNKHGKATFESIDLLKQSVGSKIDPTFSGTEYLKLTKAIENDLDRFSQQSGGDLAFATKEAREYWKNYKKLDDNPVLQALKTQNPEDVVPALFGRRKVTELKELKSELPAAFKLGKQYFTKDLLQKPNLPGELQKIDPDVLNTIYSKRELSLLNDLSKTKGLLKTAERIAGNPSGTGQIVSTSLSTLPLASLFSNPISAIGGSAAMFGAPAVASRAYLSGPVTRALTTGIGIPAISQGVGGGIRNALIQGLLQRKLQREKARNQ